jgi:signal transduction histidine kinase
MSDIRNVMAHHGSGRYRHRMQEAPRLTRLTPLIEEAASVAGEADLGKMLRTLLDEAKATTDAPYAALGVIGEHRVLSEFIYDGISPKQAKAIGAPPTGKGVLGTLIRDNETLVLDTISDHPDSVGFPEHHPLMRSFLGVPVSVGDEAFGNLYLTDKEGGFTGEDVAAVEALSRIAGAAIQMARLQTRLRRLAVAEDRQRIARDLHDSVIQDLFAVGLELQGLGTRVDDSEVSTVLDKSIDTLDDVVNRLRRYVFELKDTRKLAMRLDERLQSLVARMGSAYPARVQLTLDVVEGGESDDEVVFLVTEALSNALRHSQAEHVEVVLTRDDDQVVLRVMDDGVGFDPGELEGGMGISNMRTRALGLGGTVHVSSERGDGTTVEVRFPVSR